MDERPPAGLSHERIYRVMSGEARDGKARLLRSLTRLATPAYRAAVTGRNSLYTAGVLPATPLGRPTISVGNLTAGGTGKTPMVIALARRLTDMGHRPAVLLRGYDPGRADAGEQSDEATELRAALGPAVPVMPNRDRVEGAKQVLANHPEVSAFLLDDGFQHRRAARDLNLVLIDALRPFGYGYMLPRGLLREPPTALRRADAVILTRVNRATPEALAHLRQQIAQLTGRAPVAEAEHDWSGLRLEHDQLPLDHLADRAVLGVAGIGNPQDFEARLKEVAPRCVGCLSYDDHHRYTPAELKTIEATARQRGADALVITEKDFVKWPTHPTPSAALPVYRPAVEMAFRMGEAELTSLMAEAVGPSPRKPADNTPPHPPADAPGESTGPTA